MFKEKSKMENIPLKAQEKYLSDIEKTQDVIENFDILETITNVGNDEVFTPRKVCDMMLDSLPEEVWHHPEYHWLNPCSKNGIFEREIALRLDQGLKEEIPDELERRKHILQKMIFSIGLTKFTSEVARRTLYYCNEANRKCDGERGKDGHFLNGFAIGNGTWFDTKEGNIKTPSTQHEFVKKRCVYCKIPDDSQYVVDPIQNEQYAYEFIHHTPDHLKKYLADKFFGGNQEMHFDIIIGNPPYQLADGGAGASARPIYHLFIEQAIQMNPEYLSMIVPSRWMIGGKGLDKFRKNMIEDRHIEKLFDFLDEKKCFSTTIITGGVCYFVWNRNFNGKCLITTNTLDGKIQHSKRYLDEGDAEIFIRSDFLISIKNKALSLREKTMDSIVSASKPYGFRAETMLNAEKIWIA